VKFILEKIHGTSNMYDESRREINIDVIDCKCRILTSWQILYLQTKNKKKMNERRNSQAALKSRKPEKIY